MALGLHSACKARLVASLEEHLPVVKVNKRRYVDYSSAVGLLTTDKILPREGPVRQKLREFSDDQPFFEFTIDMIGRMLLISEKYSMDAEEQPLVTHGVFKNISVVANHIVEAFDSLPWQYTHTFRLPKDLGHELTSIISDYTLSREARVTQANEEFITKYPLITGSENLDALFATGTLLFPKPPEWDPNAIYFQTQTEGYVSQYGSAKTSVDAESTLRTFFGLGLALRIFKYERSVSLYRLRDSCYVHKFRSGAWNLDAKIDMEVDLSEAISHIMLNIPQSVTKGEVKLKRAWIIGNLIKIGMCVANADKAQRVLLASRWLFDSHIGQNELLSFVQMMVAIEILLGDRERSDLLGLGELLKNRCAYLIGKSQAQRDSILRDFGGIYDVRSQIVHRGKSRLSSTERRKFFQLQWMCIRVIQEEMELLEKDVQNHQTSGVRQSS